jgi:hypothetical protein
MNEPLNAAGTPAIACSALLGITVVVVVISIYYCLRTKPQWSLSENTDTWDYWFEDKIKSFLSILIRSRVGQWLRTIMLRCCPDSYWKKPRRRGNMYLVSPQSRALLPGFWHRNPTLKFGGEYPRGREAALANMPDWFFDRLYKK